MIGKLRWLTTAGVLGAALAIQSAAMSKEPPKQSADGVVPDQQKLNGVWLVRSAEMNNASAVGQAWTSKITIEDGGFTVSRFCGSSKDRNGKFTLNPAATPKTVDLEVDEIDLSELWEGVTYPKCSLRGIYELKNDSLTICFRTGSNLERPKDFEPKGKNTLVLSLDRVDASFKEFPKDVRVMVTDPAGKPVAGAIVFQFMWLSRDPKKEEVVLEWKYSEIAKTGADGSARVAYGELAICPVAVRDVDHKLTGFASVSPASLQKGTVRVTLQPECHISGTIACDELTKAGKSIWTNVYLFRAGQRIGMCDADPGRYEFQLPPGKYTLDAYGENLRTKYVDVVVPAGQTDFRVPPISLIASNSFRLEGKPAPELEGVVGWRGEPTKLADLKGKYVLIDFWGYWCGPCVEAMPVLIDLHERFKDKGLAIIGVHCDMEGEVDTPAKLDEKIAQLKKKFWQGKDLPFPIALTTKSSADDDQPAPGTATQYGILGYPTTVLIDREGKVVGQFQARDKQQATAEIEKLLKSK